MALQGRQRPPPPLSRGRLPLWSFWISRGERDNENLGGTRVARPRACVGWASPLLFLSLLPTGWAGSGTLRGSPFRDGAPRAPPSCHARGGQPRKEMEISLEQHAEQTGGRPSRWPRPPGALPHTPLPPPPAPRRGWRAHLFRLFRCCQPRCHGRPRAGTPSPPLTQPARGGCPRFLAPGVANVSRRQDHRRATTPCRRQPPPRASSQGRCSPFLFPFPPTSLLAIRPPPTPPPLPSSFFF